MKMELKKRPLSAFFLIPATVLFFTAIGSVSTASTGDTADSCTECHGNSQFRVTNKQLYKYYRDWELSMHASEGVTCVDCHGGNPEEGEQKEAHGKDIKQLLSPVNYEHISSTCGKCHEINAENYKKSKHYKKLLKAGLSNPTPTCVNCHGSINTSIPTADAIAEICSHCHNVITENHPEIPEIARYLIDRLSFVNSYYRHVMSKGVTEKSPEFCATMDLDFSELAEIWHRLDLEGIEEKTLQIRAALIKQRKKLRLLEER
jgi:nitrate/TMAO reductase-like tetraheme cytochrome c subunit